MRRKIISFALFMTVFANGLLAEERIVSSYYTIFITTVDANLKLPYSCKNFFTIFKPYNEVCDSKISGVDENSFSANTYLKGRVGFKRASAGHVDFSYDINQDDKKFIQKINLKDIKLVAPYKKIFFGEVHPYDLIYEDLVSVTLKVELVYTYDTRGVNWKTIKSWQVVLTKENNEISIDLPELNEPIKQTNTYDIDGFKECIDGKVWIKKYSRPSGATCGWKTIGGKIIHPFRNYLGEGNYDVFE